MKSVTARKSTGGAVQKRSTAGTGSESPEHDNDYKDDAPSSATVTKSSDNNRASRHSSHNALKPSPDVSPMELQIRQVELMEEQCDSLEKLVEIASERRDIEKEILEIKKRKLAILEKNMQN